MNNKYIPSSHLRLTVNEPEVVDVWPSAAWRFKSGLAVAISASRTAALDADCSCS